MINRLKIFAIVLAVIDDAIDMLITLILRKVHLISKDKADCICDKIAMRYLMHIRETAYIYSSVGDSKRARHLFGLAEKYERVFKV